MSDTHFNIDLDQPTAHFARTSRPLSNHKRWIQCLVLIAGGLVLYHVFEHKLIGALATGIGFLLLTGILVSPTILVGFDTIARVLTKTVGLALSWLLLTPLFYILFGFGRFILILLKRDPMKRRFDPTLDSYWVKAKLSSKRNHQKQY